jgi:hypothetical protein
VTVRVHHADIGAPCLVTEALLGRPRERRLP